MRAAVALTVVLASLLAGCTDEKSTTQTTQAAGTTEAADTNAAQAAPAAGFEDDFSTEDGKWPTTKGTWGTALTFADQYQITLNGGNDYVYVGPAAAFGGPGEVLNPVGDSTQAVEVSSEAERINVGLMCRWNG
jgi:hypothetical protein